MKNRENDKMDFTQGSILKKLLRFMVPILGALILQAAYGAVDLLVVGRFGSTSGLSGVSTGSQVLNLVTFVVTQLAMGITVLIARYLGEKKEEQIGSIIGGGTVVFAAISLVLFVVMVGFARPIAVLMQAPEEAVGLTAAYIRICGAGIFFIVAYNVLSAIFRGLGDSNSPLLFVFVACIVNIVGDLVLVAGLGMDAMGAALATVFAQALSVVFAIVRLVKKGLPFTITGYDFRWNPQCGKFLQIGLPLALQEYPVLFESDPGYSASSRNQIFSKTFPVHCRLYPIGTSAPWHPRSSHSDNGDPGNPPYGCFQYKNAYPQVFPELRNPHPCRQFRPDHPDKSEWFHLHTDILKLHMLLLCFCMLSSRKTVNQFLNLIHCLIPHHLQEM